MKQPTEADADTPSVTRALAVLTNLRAEDYIAGDAGDSKAFGLDTPKISITWDSDRQRTLKIGDLDKRTGTFYASLEGEPFVFTLSPEVVGLFNVEFRDHRVLSFPAARAQRVKIEWHGRTLVLNRRGPVPRGQVEWAAEQPEEARDIDLSRVSSLVSSLANLQTEAFAQYAGDLPVTARFDHPRLRIEISFGDAEASKVLRIGGRAPDSQLLATVAAGNSGEVFLLQAPPWDELIRSGERYAPIPDNPFAPGP